jgi:hypothetical protein
VIGVRRLPRIRRSATTPRGDTASHRSGKHDPSDTDAATSGRRTAPDLVPDSLLDVVAALD